MFPEIERQQKQGKEVLFRAKAAFAKPQIYEALEGQGEDESYFVPYQSTTEPSSAS